MKLNLANTIIKKIKSLEPKTLHQPVFFGNEVKYLKQCIKTGFVSSVGNFVSVFERKIKKVTGSKYVVAVINGTYALELIIRCLKINKNEEVFLPSLTFVATANAIKHTGAIPHFVDVEENNLGICPEKLENYIKKSLIKKNGKLFNPKTKRYISALVAVHLYGFSCKILNLKKICKKYNLILIEDAAESIGSKYRKKHLGTFSKAGILSFNGNKTITCGNGGVILTSDKSLAEKAKHLSTTAKKKHKFEYLHDDFGFNLRLSNVNAAIGCAQLEKLKKIIKMKRKNFRLYKNLFKNNREQIEILQEPKNCVSNYWLICLKLKNNSNVKNSLLNKMQKNKIFSRAIWKPLHTLDIYKKFPRANLNTTNKLYNTIINLPSSPILNIKK